MIQGYLRAANKSKDEDNNHLVYTNLGFIRVNLMLVTLIKGKVKNVFNGVKTARDYGI